MIVRELREAIEGWPENAVVEVSVSSEADMISPHWEANKSWYELCDATVDEDNLHGLLIAGKIVMC